MLLIITSLLLFLYKQTRSYAFRHNLRRTLRTKNKSISRFSPSDLSAKTVHVVDDVEVATDNAAEKVAAKKTAQVKSDNKAPAKKTAQAKSGKAVKNVLDAAERDAALAAKKAAKAAEKEASGKAASGKGGGRGGGTSRKRVLDSDDTGSVSSTIEQVSTVATDAIREMKTAMTSALSTVVPPQGFTVVKDEISHFREFAAFTHEIDKQKLELKEREASARHSREMDIMKIQAENMLHSVNSVVGVLNNNRTQKKRTLSAVGGPVPDANKQCADDDIEPPPSKKACVLVPLPLSTMSILNAMLFCREWMAKAKCGGDLSNITKPEDIVTYCVNFLGDPPDLEAQVKGANNVRDRLNYVVDVLSEGS